MILAVEILVLCAWYVCHVVQTPLFKLEIIPLGRQTHWLWGLCKREFSRDIPYHFQNQPPETEDSSDFQWFESHIFQTTQKSA